jgi:hypothetical protein
MRSADLLIWLAVLRGNADQENLEFLAMLKERMQVMLALLIPSRRPAAVENTAKGARR